MRAYIVTVPVGTPLFKMPLNKFCEVTMNSAQFVVSFYTRMLGNMYVLFLCEFVLKFIKFGKLFCHVDVIFFTIHSGT